MIGLRVRQRSLWRSKWLVYTSLLVVGFVSFVLSSGISREVVRASSLVAPSLVSPQDGTIIRGDSYTQSWSAVSGAVKYRYESYYDANANSLKYSDKYTGTAKLATGVSDVVYWWRVRAIDSSGAEGQWSPLWKITIDNTKPVTSLSVAASRTQNGYYVGTVSVIGKVADQEKNLATNQYEIKNPDSTTTQIGPIVAVGNSHMFALDTSHGDGDYVVKYTATDKAGNISAPATVTIKVDNTAPAPAVLTGAPARYMQPGTVSRSWNKSPSSDAATYLYKSFYTENDARTNPDAASARYSYQYAAGQASYNLVGGTGTEERTFWYRVATTDYAGNRTWSSDVYSVTVDSTPPAAPVILVPGIASGSVTQGTSITAEWDKPAADTARYDVRYRADADSDWQTTSATDTRYTAPLVSDDTYRIQVRAVDLAGNVGDWSPEFVVTRDATPPVVSMAAGAWSANAMSPTVTVTGETSDVTYRWSVPIEVQISDAEVAMPIFTVPGATSAVYDVSLTVRDTAGNTTVVPLRLVYTAPASESSAATPVIPPAVPASVQTPPAGQTNTPITSTTVVPRTSSVTAPATVGGMAVARQNQAEVVAPDTPSVDAPLNTARSTTGEVYDGAAPHDEVLGAETSGWQERLREYWWVIVACGISLLGSMWWLLVARRRKYAEERES